MSSKYVIEITDSNFSEAINSGVTLVDFWAPWCSPCLMQGPIIEKLAEQFKGKVNIGKMNVDSGSSTASQFGIRGIPTLILFENGQEVNRFVGVQMEGTLVEAIGKHLNGEDKDSFVEI